MLVFAWFWDRFRNPFWLDWASTSGALESFGPSSAPKFAKGSQGEGEEAKEKGKKRTRSLKGAWGRSGGGGGEICAPLRGESLLAIGSPNQLGLVPARKLLFSMSSFASIFG